MNTPAHVVLNLLVVRKGQRERLWLPILGGSLLPDLPMFFFYGMERVLRGTPEARIWGQLYFEEGWQLLFDVPNSLLLVLAGLVAARLLHSRWWTAWFLSMGLHVVTDLLLHHDDAHRHFLPVSDWRFESPVSYWDPRHFGHWFAPFEMLGVLLGSLHLIWVSQAAALRVLACVLLGGYAAFVLFAVIVWLPGA